jgi:hypothetical protein
MMPPPRELRWATNLEAPILSGVAPSGDLLFVRTFDGTIRAMVHDPRAPSHVPPGEPAVSSSRSRRLGRLALGALLLLSAATAWRVAARRRARASTPPGERLGRV